MDLTSYAELAVRLVNAGGSGGLATPAAYLELTADRPHLGGPVTPADLDSLRLLRDELAQVFALAAGGAGPEAVGLLNALLARHPVHPQVSGHDGQPWHLHLCDSGSPADRYGAGAVFGLTAVVTTLGPGALRVCAAASCPVAFIDSSPDGSGRQCPRHGRPRAIVTSLRAGRATRQRQAAPVATG
ncbi:MAG TPA: CGNR zinc finger domain-containing protein [Streptosporangiaceae bacterium]|nr:CGNR zinc finger domain-containing protein [Streptosporangiaceae bacterium]